MSHTAPRQMSQRSCVTASHTARGQTSRRGCVCERGRASVLWCDSSFLVVCLQGRQTCSGPWATGQVTVEGVECQAGSLGGRGVYITDRRGALSSQLSQTGPRRGGSRVNKGWPGALLGAPPGRRGSRLPGWWARTETQDRVARVCRTCWRRWDRDAPGLRKSLTKQDLYCSGTFLHCCLTTHM